MGYKLTLISETEKMLASKLVKQLWGNWGCNQFSIKKTSIIESFHHGQQMRKVYAETYRWFDAFIFLIHFQHGGLKGNNRNNIYKNIHRHISRGLSFFSKKLKTALPHTHSHFTGKRTLSFCKNGFLWPYQFVECRHVFLRYFWVGLRWHGYGSRNPWLAVSWMMIIRTPAGKPSSSSQHPGLLVQVWSLTQFNSFLKRFTSIVLTVLWDQGAALTRHIQMCPCITEVLKSM